MMQFALGHILKTLRLGGTTFFLLLALLSSPTHTHTSSAPPFSAVLCWRAHLPFLLCCVSALPTTTKRASLLHQPLLVPPFVS